MLYSGAEHCPDRRNGATIVPDAAPIIDAHVPAFGHRQSPSDCFVPRLFVVRPHEHPLHGSPEGGVALLKNSLYTSVL